MIKHKHGFTLVELAVVITVMVILAAIISALYMSTQMKARDTTRSNNIKALGTLLNNYYDRNGFYPTGCGSATCPDYSTSSTWGYVTGNSIISAATTTSQLSAILKQDTSTMVDPSLTTTTPFIGGADVALDAPPGYVYRGGIALSPTNTSVSGVQRVVTLNERSSGRTCNVDYNLSPGAQKPYDTSSFLLAYYAESTKTWQVYTGIHGVKPYIESGGTAGFCTIVN